VKLDGNRETVMMRIRNDAIRSNLYSPALLDSYMGLFDEIFTLTDLNAIIQGLPEVSVSTLKASLSLQFKLEFGLLN